VYFPAMLVTDLPVLGAFQTVVVDPPLYRVVEAEQIPSPSLTDQPFLIDSDGVPLESDNVLPTRGIGDLKYLIAGPIVSADAVGASASTAEAATNAAPKARFAMVKKSSPSREKSRFVTGTI